MDSENFSGKQKKHDTAFLLKVILPFGLLIVGLIGGFAGGVHYQKGRAPINPTTMSADGGFQQNGPVGGRMQFSGTMGSVTAISASSITVQDQRSGTAKTYGITSSTAITNNGASATYSDIAVGNTVLVRSSSDTSTDATTIEVNPSFGGGPSFNSSGGTSTNTN